MERDAEGSKIKGPLPVRAGGPHHQEVAHTTTNLHPLQHKKHGGLRRNFPNSKKVCPSPGPCPSLERKQEKITQLCVQKIKSVTGHRISGLSL